MAKKPKDAQAQLAGLQGTFITMTQVVRANTMALEQIKQQLDALKSNQNLIPALCHSLDRLQAEFTALRLEARPRKRAKL